jgi:hypothetical protein
MNTYELLEARCLPIIEAYHTDLTKHDRDYLERNPKTPFLHFTRTCGTHIAPLEPASEYPLHGEFVPYLFGRANRQQIADGVLSIVRHCAKDGETKLALYFDGRQLRSITPAKAVELAEDYRRGLLHLWDQEKRRQYAAN